MDRLNYDVFSEIFNFLSNKDCYNLSISSKSVYKIIKNNGFLKVVEFNNNYPARKFSDGYDVMNGIIFHKRRVETIRINFVNDPIQWIPYWSKRMVFNRCYFNKVNPSKPVYTEYLYIKTDCKDVEINYSKFPYLKELVIEN